VISNQLLVMCDQLSAFSKSRGGIKSSNPPEAEERRFGIKSSNPQFIKSSNQQINTSTHQHINIQTSPTLP
ncbi:MAG: hypothetical protein RBR28_15245, partial [Lentimicrobium sp.]|nr:hypothetical protein [Lentimicrobium sp.]